MRHHQAYQHIYNESLRRRKKKGVQVSGGKKERDGDIFEEIIAKNLPDLGGKKNITHPRNSTLRINSKITIPRHIITSYWNT